MTFTEFLDAVQDALDELATGRSETANDMLRAVLWANHQKGVTCRRGHIRTTENTRTHKDGSRQCLDCRRANDRKRYQQRQATKLAAGSMI
jgi:hypothetical protein